MATFPKSDKLCGQLRIQQLYQEGKKMTIWPLRVTYLPCAETKILIWAPKALFKHAVDRNRLRRLIREAWRLSNKPEGTYWIGFNYMDKEIQSYAVIEKAVNKAIRKIDETSTT